MTIDSVIKRLKSLGYQQQIQNNDYGLLFLISKIKQELKDNLCWDEDELPQELDYVLIDRVCGAFLKEKRASGSLQDSDFITKGSLVSIKAGDVEHRYAQNNEQKIPIDQLIEDLCNSHKYELNRWRKLSW